MRYGRYDFGPLTNSASWTVPQINDGDEAAKDVTVTGAALGDWANASLSVDIADLQLDAQVTAADTVTCVLSNSTGTAAGNTTVTVYVKVEKRL